MHIMKWLGNRLKHRLFTKSVAAEIDPFIAEGRCKGTCAGLLAKAEYIWHTGSGYTQRQSDLRRLKFERYGVARCTGQRR